VKVGCAFSNCLAGAAAPCFDFLFFFGFFQIFWGSRKNTSPAWQHAALNKQKQNCILIDKSHILSEKMI